MKSIDVRKTREDYALESQKLQSEYYRDYGRNLNSNSETETILLSKCIREKVDPSFTMNSSRNGKDGWGEILKDTELKTAHGTYYMIDKCDDKINRMEDYRNQSVICGGPKKVMGRRCKNCGKTGHNKRKCIFPTNPINIYENWPGEMIVFKVRTKEHNALISLGNEKIKEKFGTIKKKKSGYDAISFSRKELIRLGGIVIDL